MKIQLRELNKDNWLETAKLSVSEQQKDIFPICQTADYLR